MKQPVCSYWRRFGSSTDPKQDYRTVTAPSGSSFNGGVGGAVVEGTPVVVVTESGVRARGCRGLPTGSAKSTTGANPLVAEVNDVAA